MTSVLVNHGLVLKACVHCECLLPWRLNKCPACGRQVFDFQPVDGIIERMKDPRDQNQQQMLGKKG